MAHPLDILRRIHRLDQAQINMLSGLMQESHMPRGARIDGNSSIQNTSYYIMRGAARAFYTKDGKEHTMSFAFDDEYLMTHLVINSEDIPLTITFMEPTDIVYLPNRKLHETMIGIEDLDHHEGLLFMNASLLHYNKYLEERIYVLQSMTASERYEWTLKRYPRILECATITQIASYLGITKETLYRIRSGKYI